MTIRPFPTKDPDSNLRYYWDWRDWLAIEDCGPVVSYGLDILASDGSLVAASIVQGSDEWEGVFQVWISGGTEGETYTACFRIAAEDGTVEDDSRTITIDPH